MREFWKVLILVVAAAELGSPPASRGQLPELRWQQSSLPPAQVILSVRPHTNFWACLETTTNLSDWTPRVNLLTTNSSIPYVDYPGATIPLCFYRLRQPGIGVTDASNSWHLAKPSHFQYQFETTLWIGSGVALKGTVSLRNGIKTVSEVTTNNFPSTNYNPADFLTIEELFTQLKGIELRGAKLAHVSYDFTWHHPTDIAFIAGQNAGLVSYRISGFAPLPP